MMDISATGLHFIEGFEGYSFHAYWDSYGHVWTVGYGETEGIGPSSTQTRAQAEADLRNRMIREYEPAIKQLGVPLTQNQFDALCSFVWNVGPGSMQWDVGRFLRAREYGAAANALLQYDHAGGVVLAGLQRRRAAERALFLTPDRTRPEDPHHYERYLAGPGRWRLRTTGQLISLNERGLVQRYDVLYGKVATRGQAVALRPYLRLCRDRIWRLAHEGPHVDFHTSWRWWRWQKLNDRLHGAVKL